MCGGNIPSDARAKAGVATDLGELELVPRSGTNLSAEEGIESGNPLPIIIDSILMERDGPKGVVRGSIAEPMSDRRGFRERLFVKASNDAEVYDRKTSKQGVRIGRVVILELLLRAKSNFVAVTVGIGHSDILDRDTVQILELRRNFGPRWKLSKSDTTGYPVFSELELSWRRHGRG